MGGHQLSAPPSPFPVPENYFCTLVPSINNLLNLFFWQYFISINFKKFNLKIKIKMYIYKCNGLGEVTCGERNLESKENLPIWVWRWACLLVTCKKYRKGLKWGPLRRQTPIRSSKVETAATLSPCFCFCYFRNTQRERTAFASAFLPSANTQIRKREKKM